MQNEEGGCRIVATNTDSTSRVARKDVRNFENLVCSARRIENIVIDNVGKEEFEALCEIFEKAQIGRLLVRTNWYQSVASVRFTFFRIYLKKFKTFRYIEDKAKTLNADYFTVQKKLY